MRGNGIVIFHIGRCGSTILSKLLEQNSNIQCESEIFNPYMEHRSKCLTVPSLDQIINQIKSQRYKPLQVIEIKFLEEQHLSIFNISLPEMIFSLKEYGYDRFIILERKNYLRRMISHCVAQETKTYHLNINHRSIIHKIKLDVDAIKVGVKTYPLIKWFEIFSSNYYNIKKLLKNDVLYLCYEDDIENDAFVGYRKTCQFLGIKAEDVEITLTKTNPFETEKILINYKVIQNVLLKTKYKWMLMETLDM